MKFFIKLSSSIVLLSLVQRANAQSVSAENLVNIHNLNSAEISALVSPSRGSLVYNTDSNKLFVYDGSNWIMTASVDTTSLSNRINQRVKYTDTAAMLVGYVRKSDTATMLANYLNSASNGLNVSGKDVRMGGNLTGATTITNNSNALTFATGGTALNITGLTSGALTDSLLSVNASTGRVNRIATSQLNKSDSTTASNGLTLTGKDVRLGGSLSSATTITTTAANTLAVSGLQSGTTSDSLLVTDASTGVLKRIASSRITGGTPWFTTGNSGTNPASNFIGTTDNVDLVFRVNNNESGRLGLYSLSTSYGYNSLAAYKSTAVGYAATTSTGTEATALGNDAQATGYRSVAIGSESRGTGASSVAVGQAAQAGYQATAIGMSSSATGNNATAIGFGATTTQANALILGNSSAQVGIGTSTPGYALDVNAGSNPLKLSGLLSGASTDSLLTINSSGVVRRITSNRILVSDSTTASNGLTLTGKDVRLGGNLTGATTITNNTNTLTFATGGTALNITGLTSGVLTDSLLTVNPSTGRINRIAPSQISTSDSTTASNGLTLTGKDVRLGGSLTAATTVTTTATNTLSVAGLQSGSTNDSIVMISSTNVLKRINASSIGNEPFNVLGGTTKASTNTQNIYTMGTVSVGKSTSAATLEVAGKIKADSAISAPNYVSTYQNFGTTGGSVTWNLQNGATAGIILSSNATLTITNATAGCYGLIRVTQNSTGGKSITLPSGSKVINGGGSSVSLTQAANAVDILTFFYDGTNYWWTIGNNYN